MRSVPGSLVISLDFELHWGVRDHSSVAAYRENLAGVREAIPAMLALFGEHGIRATWATVGMLFARDREELLAHAPAQRPAYLNRDLDPYAAIDSGELGADEASDPFHYAASLVDAIARTPGQEIGTHTFSHYYCLEPLQTAAEFDADLRAARAIAEKRGVQLRSIVFPRNQVHAPYLHALSQNGIRAFRGNPSSWLYEERAGDEETLARRAGRLLDAYIPLTGQNGSTPTRLPSGLVNVPASRFLRPYSPRLARLDPLRIARIKREMTSAAERNVLYHLWWHPHNFGKHLAENLALLGAVLQHFQTLRKSKRMRSANMADIARDMDDLPNS